jgi:DNA repair protein RadC
MLDNKFWEDLKSGKFLSMVKESSKGKALSGSREAYNILKPLFADEGDVEKAFFIFMDQKNKIISIENLFKGSIAGSLIFPREIVKRVIQLKANAFLMAHNHPSGDPQPSKNDRVITMRIVVAAMSVDVSFHDHIIIGDSFFSMADQGIIRSMKEQVHTFMKEISI